ncbi:MAG: hypothetical protein A2750_02085 [Candidatus Yanofskybacteria bacterium RIFCSPHIGHO2_01_FULL_45_42]|uniref:Uncharacterized protein n=2 Tax=Candidatus Yanofskyibacteriota TaxID=1752733 RepID=A0A1F8FQ89_9BACT|nr:MAG: hypothetical protein A2750_02085 [Candidatus Yanofskybacteria bacterium RIFCSPHIGHO2_01_FULL_45_42]OGN15232.1 MAG: hypothetical protein A3J47_03655 [Candidatus Yanofskybacteria bacterium RIFCSPHIGHO2_02_FULL_43_22]
MTFKPKQLDPKAVKIFSENEVGTLLEDIDNKLELILEGQDGIKSDIRSTKNNYEQLEERVGRTEVRLDTVGAR